MNPKVPWLPAEVQPGQKTETCPRCGANKMIPWTLARDPKRIGLLRTWVCTACQLVEERAEAEDYRPPPLANGPRARRAGDAAGAGGVGPPTTADFVPITRGAVPTPWPLCRRLAA